MASDANYASVSLLLHGDGADGASTFTDNSPIVRTTTNSTGTVTNSTTKIKYGSASLRFGGSAIISTGSASDWSWMHQSGGKFTWEAWVSCDSFAAERVLFSTSNGSTGNQGLYVAITTGRGLAFQIYNASGSSGASTIILLDGAAGSFPNDANFHHIAIQWDQSLVSSNLTWYVDGVLAYTGNKSANSPGSGVATATLKHGGYATSASLLGYLDDIRITKDVIRYAATFTPSTEAFPNQASLISGVVYDDAGDPCARTVRIYDRTTGALLSSGTSDAGTGAYSLAAGTSEIQRIVLDDSGGTLYNDIIDRVIPA